MDDKLLAGVYAALLTPRDENGGLDEQALTGLVRRLGEHGLQGFVVNGATGEFCLTTRDELRRMLRILRENAPAGRQRLCGIGSTSVRASVEMAEEAAAAGVVAVLLPPPYFFPYAQEDVVAFCTTVADRSPVPVILYNLPQFTSPINVDTAVRLITDHPNIVGIKDSSGSLEILTALGEARVPACRAIGNDAVLVTVLERNLCDAVISGVACALPEVISGIFEGGEHGRAHGEYLAQVLDRIGSFPTPWAIKWLAEARGFAPARFAQAVSEGRRRQGADLQRWFGEWWPSVRDE